VNNIKQVTVAWQLPRNRNRYSPFNDPKINNLIYAAKGSCLNWFSTLCNEKETSPTWTVTSLRISWE